MLGLDGFAFWSVLVVLLLDELFEDVPLLPVCASATAPESTRIAMMLSVLFITYLVKRFDSASAFKHSTKLGITTVMAACSPGGTCQWTPELDSSGVSELGATGALACAVLYIGVIPSVACQRGAEGSRFCFFRVVTEY